MDNSFCADNLPYEKVGKNEPVCIADEVPFEIPDSWEWARISNVFQIEMGQSPKGDSVNNLKNGMEFHQGKVFFGEKYISISDQTTVSPTKIAVPDSILLCVRAPVGKVNITNRALCIGRGLCALKPLGGVNIDFAFHMFEMYENIFVKQATGTTFVAITGEVVKNQIIPLPPLSEQVRIVSKIKEVLPLISQYRNMEIANNKLLKEFPVLLKKSILQEAVQGKLVPQDENDEPASILLERIRAEKQKLIAEGKIKKDKHESIIFRRDNSHYEKCGSKEENIDDIIPFELPNSWEWIRLSAILTSTDAGKSPQCENRPRTIGEWGVIKTTAIQDGYFLAEENKVLPSNFYLQESMVVHHGDLLITRAGPRNRTGVICVVDGEPENLILSDKTVRLSYLRNFVNPHYIMTALSSPAMQYFVVDAMTGMAASQVNISQEKMKTFLLPLPPLNEQQRIIDAVKKLFNYIDKLNF